MLDQQLRVLLLSSTVSMAPVLEQRFRGEGGRYQSLDKVRLDSERSQQEATQATSVAKHGEVMIKDSRGRD